MGMYTQVRGWINVDSIGYGMENYTRIHNRVFQTQEEFENDDTLLDTDGDPLERKWVCNDTHVCNGSNGSVFIFIGTELKNYGNPAEIWIEYLISKFPNSEGRIDFQYEEDETKCKCWKITRGEITETYEPIWCKGYGNSLN